jgi:hypothetical protein
VDSNVKFDINIGYQDTLCFKYCIGDDKEMQDYTWKTSREFNLMLAEIMHRNVWVYEVIYF